MGEDFEPDTEVPMAAAEMAVRFRQLGRPVVEESANSCESPWIHARPPNNEWVEAQTDDYRIIIAKACYGRDGVRPHWEAINGTLYNVDFFVSWRRNNICPKTGKKKDIAPENKYKIDGIIAENTIYQLKKCADQFGNILMMQIAQDGANSLIAKNAYVLQLLYNSSIDIESKTHGNYNYHLGFPNIVDSFVSENGRYVNIISINNVNDFKLLFPLIRIWKNKDRIDVFTSAWIIGKLLKTISFACDNNIGISTITGNNILINSGEHYPIVFDWSMCNIYDNGVPRPYIRNMISSMVKLVIRAMGGLDVGRINNVDDGYLNLLNMLSVDGMDNAHEAHDMFYNVVESLCDDPNSNWKRGFHEFTIISNG